MKNRLRQLSSILLTGLVVTGSLFSSFTSFAAGDNVIHIKTVNDLKDFAGKCRQDNWSLGKTVILDNDLKMPDDIDIVIPSFAGVFNGNGHTISNVTISEAASNTGFFGLILQEGSVSDLNVEGKYKPEEIMSHLGGIAGSNYGLIKNCTYSGKIKAEREIGGVVGYNMDTGVVSGCEFSGYIEGNVSCGGVVGYNEGRVESCVNNGKVNTSYEDKSITEDELTDTLENIVMGESLTGLRGFHTRMDVGGVVGFSEGEVFSCVNHGKVGYEHVGYNTGGVVGRSTGFIKDCINTGKVYGRKDVGGVVGQQQPYLVMDFTEGDLNELHGEVKNLNGLVNNALNSASSHTASTTNSLLTISGMTDRAIDDIDSLAGTASEGAAELSDTAQDSIDASRLMIDDVDEYLNNVMDAVDEFADEIEYKEDQLDMSAQELDELNMSISDARNALRSTRDVFLGVPNSNLPGVRISVPDVQRMASSFSATADQLQELLYSISSMADGGLSGAGESVRDAIDDEPGFYDDAMDIIDTFDQFNQQASDLNKDLREGGTDLYGTMGEITDEVNRTINDVSGNVQGSLSQMQQIRQQTDKISDKMNSMLKKASDPDNYTKDRSEDVSAQDFDSATDGRTSTCTNKGIVDADFNVGGITGMMGFEFDLDPEDDAEEIGERSFDYVLRTKCVTDRSVNEAKINANRNVAGGIVGRMELGLTTLCENYGDVESYDDYAGGICGYSSAEITDSYSKQSLSARRYVGGIVGYGEKIHGCASMPGLRDGNQFIGAIAGNVKDINREDVFDNHYYSRTMFGIDGVSYQGMAENTDYNSFLGINGIPQRFHTLILSFVTDDEDDEDEEVLVETVECKYGESIPEDRIPVVPHRDGFVGVWKKKNFSAIKEDEIVEAKYSRINTLIESDEKREDGLPVLFAEGSFKREDELTVKDKDDGVSSGRFSYSVLVPDDGEESHTFRYRPSASNRNVKISVSDGDGSGFHGVKTGKMGEYVTFEASGSSFDAAIEEEWSGKKGVIIGIAILLILVVVIIFLIRLKKGKILIQRIIHYFKIRRIDDKEAQEDQENKDNEGEGDQETKEIKAQEGK